MKIGKWQYHPPKYGLLMAIMTLLIMEWLTISSWYFRNRPVAPTQVKAQNIVVAGPLPGYGHGGDTAHLHLNGDEQKYSLSIMRMCHYIHGQNTYEREMADLRLVYVNADCPRLPKRSSTRLHLDTDHSQREGQGQTMTVWRCIYEDGRLGLGYILLTITIFLLPEPERHIVGKAILAHEEELDLASKVRHA